MRCPFCGFAFRPTQSTAACPPCPLNRVCGRRRCPRCGYGAVAASPLVEGLGRLLDRWIPSRNAPTEQPPSLVDLAIGAEARVAGLAAGGNAPHAARLAAMGVLPGARIRLLRRQPAFVFQLGNSQFAIDEQVAHQILIRLPETEKSP